MLFTGTYDHTIDSKNRLSIPAQLRALLEEQQQAKRLYLVPGQPSNTLWIYPERVFTTLADQLGSELIPDEDLLGFQQRFFPYTVILEPDPQGRVLLPEKMLRQSGLGREVVICGVMDHLEIRRRDEWEKQFEADWRSFPELRLKARRAMDGNKRSPGGRPESN